MAVLVSDSFNRADSTTTLGTTDSYNGGTNTPWTVYSPGNSAVYGILTNRAYCQTLGTNSNQQFAGINVGQSDVVITVTIATISASPFVVLRATSNSNFLQFQVKPSQYILYYYNGSTWTQLGATSGVTPTSGDVIQITAQGSSITAKVNGTQRMTVTTSQNQTATIFGFAGQNNASYFDNFEIDDLNTGSSGTTYTGSGTTTGISSATGTPSFIAKGDGTSTGVSSVTGNPTFLLAAQGTSTGISAAAGTTTMTYKESGVISGLSSLTTTETFTGAVTYAASGITTAVSSLTTTEQMTWEISGETTGKADLTTKDKAVFGWRTLPSISTSWNDTTTGTTTWNDETIAPGTFH